MSSVGVDGVMMSLGISSGCEVLDLVGIKEVIVDVNIRLRKQA